MWKSYTRSYEGTDEVYVRVTQAGGGSSVQIYDIYILNEGEQSQAKKAEYDAEFEAQASGITEVQEARRPATVGIYSLNGVRLQGLRRGLNIVSDDNGSVRKVLVK